MLELRPRVPAILLFSFLLLSACNRPAATATVQPGVDIVFTAAAQTVEAQLTQATTGQQPTSTPVPDFPTNTPGATDQPSPTAPPADTPGPTAEPTEAIPCDRASFVEDVTIPDGTELLGGASFDKTWRLKNNGSCTWNASYSLVFDSGAAMGGPASVTLTTGTVAPGEEVDITVSLTAPIDAGTYRGNWKLRNAAAETFGLGENADKVFWVEIKVSPPTATPNPAFNLTYATTHDCNGQATTILQVENTGNLDFESLELTLRDVVANITLHGPAASNAPFMGQPDECPPGGDVVRSGKTMYIGAAAGSPPPPGNTVRATVKLCSAEDLGGSCLEKNIEFAAP